MTRSISAWLVFLFFWGATASATPRDLSILDFIGDYTLVSGCGEHSGAPLLIRLREETAEYTVLSAALYWGVGSQSSHALFVGRNVTNYMIAETHVRSIWTGQITGNTLTYQIEKLAKPEGAGDWTPFRTELYTASLSEDLTELEVVTPLHPESCHYRRDAPPAER